MSENGWRSIRRKSPSKNSLRPKCFSMCRNIRRENFQRHFHQIRLMKRFSSFRMDRKRLKIILNNISPDLVRSIQLEYGFDKHQNTRKENLRAIGRIRRNLVMVAKNLIRSSTGGFHGSIKEYAFRQLIDSIILIVRLNNSSNRENYRIWNTMLTWNELSMNPITIRLQLFRAIEIEEVNQYALECKVCIRYQCNCSLV